MSAYNSTLMGANFRPQEAKDIVSSLQEGDALRAVREPANPYHENAIAIFFDDTHIGYIERALADELSPLMDAGAELTITVAGWMKPPLKPFLDIDVVGA